MAARQNALGELTRFWLEARHDCLLGESAPVPVPYGLSDIDFVAIRSDLTTFQLPGGETVGPRLIVESKDEHDFDPKGKDFGKRLSHDVELISESGFIPAEEKAKFTMLRQQHFEVANRIFGTTEFDRLFVVHELDPVVRRTLANTLKKHRIFWVTVRELVADLLAWYEKHERPSGLRHTLTGDMVHLLVGYCGLEQISDSKR